MLVECYVKPFTRMAIILNICCDKEKDARQKYGTNVCVHLCACVHVKSA